MDMPGTYKNGDPMPPLDPNGADFPCSVPSFTADGDGPTLTPGQGGQIRLFGTAVHSGGSCQISITYDQPPNRNSVWKVMKSFQGGCPIDVNGNLPDIGDPTKNPLPALQYTVPQGLPSGKGTVAWTWFNKSGNREMYMRCHKATIGGSGGSKATFNSLPDMFIANINGLNTCRVAEGINVRFPNPGSQVQGQGDGDPTGNCGSSGSNPPPQEDTPDAPEDDAPEEDAPEEDAPEQDAPEDDAPEEDYPEQDAPPTKGPCEDGQKQCGGGTWSLCFAGEWAFMGNIAPGTDCSAILKRSIRFSAAHMSRRAL